MVAVKRLQVGIGAKLFGGICAVYRRRTSFLLFLKGGIEAIIDNRVVQRVFQCFFFFLITSSYKFAKLYHFYICHVCCLHNHKIPGNRSAIPVLFSSQKTPFYISCWNTMNNNGRTEATASTFLFKMHSSGKKSNPPSNSNPNWACCLN